MKKAINIVLVFLIAMLNYITIELSCTTFSKIFDLKHPVGLLFGFAAILCTVIVFVTIIPNRTIALTMTSICAYVLSIVNYYTFKFHGTPFTTAELSNAMTALNVISSYNFEITDNIILVTGILIVEIVLLLITRKNQEKTPLRVKIASIAALLFICIIGFKNHIPLDVVTWSWDASIKNYGYVSCEIQFERKLLNFLHEPAGFNKSAVKDALKQYPVHSAKGNTPDVILIVNESFYDLNYLTEIKTDQPAITNMYNSENAIYGYALSPIVGGCTNNSEYEFLTSNSTHLLPGVTPFNVVNFDNANSIVSHLEELGYSSLAWHTESKQNYNRENGYVGLGFDEIHFKDDFPDATCYADRYYLTDESVYDQMLEWYEGMSIGPRLVYGLTIQNHGGYDISDDSNDIIHTIGDYGELTNEINEYNTSVYLSDQALGKLFDYFEKHRERQVVVCMVGDHCPSFAKELVDNPRDEIVDQKLKSVPFIIWTNTPDNLDASVVPNSSINMSYVIPTMLKATGIETSKYYDYMLMIRDEVPKFYTWDSWYDKNNQHHYYDEYNELIDQYFQLEYYNLKYPKEFRELVK